jgi:branched-subunit amino acid transport protein
MNQSTILKGAIASGIINAIINGIINWFQLGDTTTIKLTTDSISSQEHTVFGGAVILGTSLAFILTSIAYLSLKIKNKPKYFPKVFFLALKQSVFVFGTIVIFAILFQNSFGSIEISKTLAAIVTGIIAGIASSCIDYWTKMRFLNH